MTKERIDTVEKYYAPVINADHWEKGLFWISTILSFIILFIDRFQNWLHEPIIVAYLILVLLHIIISGVKEYILLPNADSERRKQLLTNALNVKLTAETTIKYYNNPLEPSFLRLAANVFENTLFGKEISIEMLKSERLKTLSYFVVWFTLLFIRETSLQVIIIITQTLFSSEILFHWIRLEIFHREMKNIYENLFDFFSTKNGEIGVTERCYIIRELTAYESLKSLTRILLSSKIFLEKNSKLIDDWDEIRRELKIS